MKEVRIKKCLLYITLILHTTRVSDPSLTFFSTAHFCHNVSLIPQVNYKYVVKDVTIVLFKSLRNCKRRNKGNFMSKSNANKIMLCRG